MKIVRNVHKFRLKDKRSVVAIGIFDGVHLGHRAVIRRAASRAKRLGIKSIVLTFDPHPAKILHPLKAPLLLMSLEHRLRLIGEMGVNICAVAEFDREISFLEPQEFVRDYLVGRLRAKEVIVGPDFHFGKERKGNIGLLKEMGRELGFTTEVAKPVKVQGQVLSSTKIRNLIESGDLKKAQKFMGRPVAVLGTVMKGSRLGRFLGYPTANVDPHHEVIPPSGVYAVKIKFADKLYNGVLNIGRRPTFLRKKSAEIEPVIEVHIFDFKDKIYGKDLEIEFIKKIRQERKFPSRRALIKRIKLDEARARGILQRPFRD